jgi:Fe-S cluster biogenesis protein NfuA
VHALVAGNVLVGKTPDASWPELRPPIAAIVRSQLLTGMPAVLQAPQAIGAGRRTDTEIREVVQSLLDREVNPSVAAQGGAIALVEVKGGRLYIEMSGGCQGCASSQVTLRQGFERMVRRVVPEVVEIIDVTDHAGGQAPFTNRPRHFHDLTNLPVKREFATSSCDTVVAPSPPATTMPRPGGPMGRTYIDRLIFSSGRS